ncbi:MAG: hypothetical protein KDI45_13780 [Candidatus Accumulibacter sp.]|nr:hypothetical protein [Accumulibacter sp.]MCB1968134.1 hypothetical protein [Accumulibacter sp.]
MVSRKLRESARDIIASRKQPSKPSPPQADALLSDLRQFIAEAQRSAAAAVNIGLTMLYWRVGKCIRDEVLGPKRADYGEEIVATQSRQLAAAYGRGFEQKTPASNAANLRHIKASESRRNAASGTGPDGRWRVYAYDELIARDKASLDIFWLKDDSLADSDNLPPPEVIAQEIVDNLEAALEQFRLIAGDLNGNAMEATT